MKDNLYFILIAFFIAACSSERAANDPISHFSKKKTIDLIVNRKFDLEKFEVYKPWDIIKNGDCYYVYDLSNRDSMFFSLNTMNNEYSKGVKEGNGPDELIFPERFVVENNLVTICDGVRHKRFIINKKNDSTLRIELYEEVNDELSDRLSAFHGKRMAHKMLTGASWIYYFVNDVKIGEGNFPYFKETNGLNNEEKASVFRSGQQKFSSDGTKLAVCISDGCAIAFYDCTDTLFKERTMIEYFPPEFVKADYKYSKTIQAENNKTGFLDLSCSNDYVYALYAGKVLGDDIFTAYYGDHVFVYDWNGNPVRHYKLKKELFMFGVDEEKGILYGIGNDPEGCILEYKL